MSAGRVDLHCICVRFKLSTDEYNQPGRTKGRSTIGRAAYALYQLWHDTTYVYYHLSTAVDSHTTNRSRCVPSPVPCIISGVGVELKVGGNWRVEDPSVRRYTSAGLRGGVWRGRRSPSPEWGSGHIPRRMIEIMSIRVHFCVFEFSSLFYSLFV